MHCRMFNNIPGLYTLMPIRQSSNSPDVTKSIAKILPNISQQTKSIPIENHCTGPKPLQNQTLCAFANSNCSFHLRVNLYLPSYLPTYNTDTHKHLHTFHVKALEHCLVFLLSHMWPIWLEGEKQALVTFPPFTDMAAHAFNVHGVLSDMGVCVF